MKIEVEMKVFIFYTVVILTCARNVKLSPIENNEIPVDSISDADSNELNSDTVHEAIQPLDHEEIGMVIDQKDDTLKIDSTYDGDLSINEVELPSDNADNEDDVESEPEEEEEEDEQEKIDKKEKQYGIEIPICAQYAEVTYPLHVSHLTDCGKFYKCSNGRGYLFDCPAGEYWSVKFDRCDYPDLAGCTIDGTHQFKLQKAVKPKQASDNDEVSDEGSDEESFGEFDIDPRCEGSDPFTAVHFSNPSDCTKYYKCYMGKAYVIKCPRGQHFSQRWNRCEHPSLARCIAIKPAALSMIVPSMDKSNEKLEKQNSITLDSDYIIRDERCKDDGIDRSHPIHFSHPSDCQIFYKCFDGFAYKVRCPEGLHFNVEKHECDYPVIAKCVQNA